jgi:hypothetical protein
MIDIHSQINHFPAPFLLPARWLHVGFDSSPLSVPEKNGNRQSEHER